MNLVAMVFKYKKVIGAITALLTVLVLLQQAHSHIYNKGVQDERTRLQAEFNRQFEAQRRNFEIKLQERLQTLSDDYEAQLVIERERVKVEYRTKEVIKYVDREIEVPAECDDLVFNVISVFQQATAIVSGAANRSTRGPN